MRYLKFILLVIIILSGAEMQQCCAQNFSTEEQQQIDSLNKIIANPNNHDTLIAGAYVVLSDILYVKIDTMMYLCLKAQQIAVKGLKSNPSPVVKKSLQHALAAALNNIGYVYQYRGDISNSLEYFHKSLKIQEKIGDKKGIATTLNNIGYIYRHQEDIPNALKYYHKSLKIREGIKDKEGIATSLNNIGYIHQHKGDVSSALIYYHKSLKVQEEISDKEGVATTLNNIGVIYDNQGDIPKALAEYHKSLKILEETGDKKGIVTSLINIGGDYLKLNNLVEAKKYGEKGLTMAQEIGHPGRIRNSASLLNKIALKEANYKTALEMRNLEIQMRDSINNEETHKISVKKEAEYEYEKQKAIDDAAHDKQIAIEQEAKAKQKVIIYATAIGLVLVVVFLVFVVNRLQVTKKQKIVIETQKEVVELAHHELEGKNQEILDSITYAKRIQNAILPPLKVVKEYLHESFILYKPKDIVAGDFYWMETISFRHSALDAESPNEQIAGQARNDGSIVLFAAADCTGHGVPGAMVSVVCNNGLNRSVREFGLTDPGEILNKTREIVIAEFEKSEDEVKDGMDIALCSLTFKVQGLKLENETLNPKPETAAMLQYAGANNPLWIIRNNEIIETKADKQPIGKFDELLPYTTHTFELQKGDSIYIFSDGYVDQFGGEKGKKFKAAAFRTLLLSIQNKAMEEQQAIINSTFEDWKGDLDQIDDVCVIGVKI